MWNPVHLRVNVGPDLLLLLFLLLFLLLLLFDLNGGLFLAGCCRRHVRGVRGGRVDGGGVRAGRLVLLVLVPGRGDPPEVVAAPGPGDRAGRVEKALAHLAHVLAARARHHLVIVVYKMQLDKEKSKN